jgi:phosphoribosylformimino-5-aminoimidazole carboxamide ribotide isomerase
MDILPAIDLIDGKCVRLIQGEYNKKITYKDDPVAQAKEFCDAGAEWLHIVDLDGAKLGKPMNAEVVARIAKEVPMKIELGGGVRNEEAIIQLLEAGVTRLILGSSAIKQTKIPAAAGIGTGCQGQQSRDRGLAGSGFTKHP